METIAALKEREITETPLLLFECELPNGMVERWSTHQVEFEQATYEARVLRHSVFELRSAPEDGIDTVAKITIVLANTDSRFSQIERNIGWKGSRIRVRFVFFDLKAGQAASDSRIVFEGIVDSPGEITEATFRLTATNALSLQRVLLPDVRIQRRCPWKFPATALQREEAITGGAKGAYSPFFRCGYSADQPDGVGNLDGAEPFASCDHTRLQCEERGMFREDRAGRPTRRFGGIEYVPPTTQVRAYGEKGYYFSQALENEARYNDFVPLVYGTVWCAPLIVFAKNDGNLTRMEVLIGMGEIEGVLKLVVNDIEVPAGELNKDMTGTGWWNVISLGNRTGGFNLDYVDAQGQPLGDPYGSMAALSVVVPNRINDGRHLPKIQALVQGLKLAQYGSDGSYLGTSFTNNPAWIILDILRRCGWDLEQIDIKSFAETASYCGELIETRDLYGRVVSVPRFQCNLAIRSRRSAAEIIRGIRTASRLYLTYNTAGKLELRCENALALQQPEKPEGTNSREPLDGGWPAYEFGDGTNGYSGILRRENGEPTLRIWSRSAVETPNRLTVEFQDAFNEYQQDSLSLVDLEDVLRVGREISATLPALGLPNFDQAARIVKFHLDKSVEGNVYAEFETSVKGFGLRPGDLITLTYLKEGFDRQPFRILKVAPGANYGRVLITAQIHRDEWYRDDNLSEGGTTGVRRRRSGEVRLPRSLGGLVVDEHGAQQFEIRERFVEEADGQAALALEVGFAAPRRPGVSRAEIPLVSLAVEVETVGGELAGGQTLYYAVSAVDEAGEESDLSFAVRVVIPAGSDQNRVRLKGLCFCSNTASYNVYRGPSPAQLLRIAENREIETEFVDSGLPYTATLPPDPNFDHGNFYWRWELQPEYAATIHGRDRIGSTEAQMAPGAYEGMTVRITRGRGAGQERAVVANDATTLIVSPAWAISPDSTSYFVVAEAGWHFAAKAASSPVEFNVPNRLGATVHVMGVSANAREEECPRELAVVTRWQLRGENAPFDLSVPGKPMFALELKGGGTVELCGISFQDFENTRTISAGTLTVHFWDELSSPTPYELAAAMEEEAYSLTLTMAGVGQVEGLLQVDGEVMKIVGVEDGGIRYLVERGIHGSQASAHEAGARVYHLQKKVFVVPFVREFFGSRASGNYAHPIYLPDVRIASAEFTVRNIHGDSEAAFACFTNTSDRGLRTLSGGQIAFQVEGFLAIQTDATPVFVVQDTHSVRDVFAVVAEPPTDTGIELRVRQNEETYCTLRIEAGETLSNVVDGFGLPPLRAGAQLHLDVLAVGAVTPGRDLTVTLRL